MKTKLILLACISIALTSCKKDEAQLAQPQTPTISIEEQVADLIKKADKNLYDEVYNQNSTINRETKEPEVIIYHGVFVADHGDIASGYCQPHPTNPCFVTIIFGEGGADGGEVNVEVFNGENSEQVYSEEDHARLILNTSSPVAYNITTLNTTTQSDGNLLVNFK